MAEASDGTAGALTKGARITGDQRSSLAASFGERYAGGESIRSIAQDTGRSYGFVHGVLKESGASLRGRGGATRGPRRDVVEQPGPALGAVTEGASPERTKAKATKKAAEKATEKAADKNGDKGVKAKAAKDDKPKKKADAKKTAKKGKKG
ncbi:helix-turn-helix domain-containing protein [Microlunatus flavus]|uniref:Helix-turn-helix domain-containing protein n=1 Tax=Microlunatus flavus TaxID=1036181 RepID=A0A1H9GWY7_9ACTN|nr:helix-turn-helix domain-containing protein [Microlunatus flavus]SEQ54513.1 hypothetical protein SAMN05421756_10435 [Microlunatus flavus]